VLWLEGSEAVPSTWSPKGRLSAGNPNFIVNIDGIVFSNFISSICFLYHCLYAFAISCSNCVCLIMLIKYLYTPCTKMIDAVWKLIILVSMLYRITKASRNERVTLWVYNTYPTSVRCLCPWSHCTNPGGSLIANCSTRNAFCSRVAIFSL
jgi:hypothetical protein